MWSLYCINCINYVIYSVWMRIGDVVACDVDGVVFPVGHIRNSTIVPPPNKSVYRTGMDLRTPFCELVRLMQLYQQKWDLKSEALSELLAERQQVCYQKFSCGSVFFFSPLIHPTFNIIMWYHAQIVWYHSVKMWQHNSKQPHASNI